MEAVTPLFSRRKFVKKTALITTGLCSLGGLSQPLLASDSTPEDRLFTIGPMEGYSPHIGTIVSMLNYNRDTVINTVKSLTVPELDYLHDSKANTIGALLLHLGATDKYYQINTFENRQDFNDQEKKIWNTAMNLGSEGRKVIKGHEATYYLDMIAEVRQKTLEEFKKKDDKWLLAIDPKWSKDRPLNTYWKWFHVCEHESNHRGQMTWLKSRLPNAKESKE